VYDHLLIKSYLPVDSIRYDMAKKFIFMSIYFYTVVSKLDPVYKKPRLAPASIQNE
jgi:hypothetical protein